MPKTPRKTHWEEVYRTKESHQLSWTQAVPEPSLAMIRKIGIPRTSPIIDVGGGDSRFVDSLIERGFTDITVLDISSEALARAKARIGKEAAEQVTWIVADIATFVPQRRYAVWHDRAVFHFLTKPEEIAHYVATVAQWVTGFLVIGTFSTEGPSKCSGLDITQYSEASLAERFKPAFTIRECITHDHQTPSGTVQRFVFCSFGSSW